MRKLCRVVPLLVVLGAPVFGADKAGVSAKEQLSFGTRMAREGLWNEALFRFKQAAKQDAANPRVWNNLAVAYEATGQFEEALRSYRRALELGPSNPEVKRNYSRFVEFYQSFKPKPGAAPPSDEKALEPETVPEAGSSMEKPT